MSWGPSRIREVGLLFSQLEPLQPHSSLCSKRRSFCIITRETRLKNVSRAVEGAITLPPYITLPDTRPSSTPRRMSFPLQDTDKLIKQTYSVYVFLPEDKGQDITRKWHLSMWPV